MSRWNEVTSAIDAGSGLANTGMGTPAHADEVTQAYLLPHCHAEAFGGLGYQGASGDVEWAIWHVAMQPEERLSKRTKRKVACSTKWSE